MEELPRRRATLGQCPATDVEGVLEPSSRAFAEAVEVCLQAVELVGRQLVFAPGVPSKLVGAAGNDRLALRLAVGGGCCWRALLRLRRRDLRQLPAEAEDLDAVRGSPVVEDTLLAFRGLSECTCEARARAERKGVCVCVCSAVARAVVVALRFHTKKGGEVLWYKLPQENVGSAGGRGE